MMGIKTLTFVFGIVLFHTTFIKAKEDLNERLLELESQVTSLNKCLKRDEDRHEKLSELESKVRGQQTEIEFLKQALQYHSHESKRSHVPDVTENFPRHGLPSVFLTRGRYSRSVDPDEVAFTAKLDQRLNDVPLHTTIKFDHRIHWTDDYYDETTGVFTCPTSGLYLFAVFIQAYSVDKAVVVHLLKDGTAYMSVVSERSDDGEDDTGGNVVLLHVNKGQRVWVETYEQDNQSFWPGFTTFSGVLIHRN